MAHSARLNALTEKLISATTGLTPKDRRFQTCKDHAIKGLKDQRHARTNPFQVKESLSGLVEKFGVVNRDDIANALQTRLDKLPTTSQWLPDILALFVLLSNRPLEHTNLEDVQAIVAPPSEAPLTWDAILADDPFVEEAIWDDIERGYHSSGDDETVDGEPASDRTTSTQATSIEDEDLAALARLHIVQPDPALLEQVRASVARQSSSPRNSTRTQITELAAIRETLTMLHGLPTGLYSISGKYADVQLSPNRSTTIMDQTSQHIFQHLARIGTRLNYLRYWARSEQLMNHLQSMQHAVLKLLTNFAASAAEIEQQYISPQGGTSVSVVDVRTKVDKLVAPLLHLSDIIRQSQEPSQKATAFPLLDRMFDQAVTAQTSGDELLFDVMSNTFFVGLKTYLRSVQAWIETGNLPVHDKEVFFVQEADSHCDSGEAWQKRFRLHYTNNGHELYAPKRLWRSVPRLFAMGKLKAFLKLLYRSEGFSNDDEMASNETAVPDLDAVKSQLHMNTLLPFDVLFDQAIETWIKASATNYTNTLRHAIFEKHQFGRFLSSLGSIYFAQEGSTFREFADGLFERIIANRHSWRQDFMITEIVQNTIGAIPNVDKTSLAINTHSRDEQTIQSVSNELDCINLTYAIPWPLQNITRCSTPTTHSRAFILSLQAYHAKHILQPDLFVLRTFDLGASQLATQMKAALSLRTRLIWFTDIVQDHISSTSSILHDGMCKRMESSGDIDDMATIWSTYETNLQVCLLLNEKLAPLRGAVTNVFELCERFADWWKHHVEPPSLEGNHTYLAPRSTRELQRVQAELKTLLAFITAGLRGVSRAGGEPMLEALAERLQWGNTS